jgi:cation diffusion facilitator CzcD-associated flavoprotein CzcO
MSKRDATPDYDVIIIGAGITGLYALHRIRELGLSVRCFDAADGVGGTWHWNRYPGARFDSESYTYAYSWSQELIDEWNWSEEFAGQPETCRYLNLVADKFDLRRDINLNARIRTAVYDEAANRWAIETEEGERASCRFLITAMGALSAPNIPNIPGRDSFAGNHWHTSRWPRDPNGFGGKDIDFSGKRVGVIGTGATGIQLISELSKTAGELYVFQLKPEFAAPLHNFALDQKANDAIRARYPAIFETCRNSMAGFPYTFDQRSTHDVSPEEREAFWEELYALPGFAIQMSNFGDTMWDAEANKLLSGFIDRKIRERVDDPVIAAKLAPGSYGFGLRRLPLETRYFESYNRPNVNLIDLRETPIERIVPDGIVTTDQTIPLDYIFYATGFDAGTGSLMRIDIRGRDGLALKDKWSEELKTYLGTQTADFPNMFTLIGPQSGWVFCNIPRCSEENVEWVADCIRYMTEHGLEVIEATPDAEAAYTEEVAALVENSLMATVDSWFWGSNVEGKKRSFLMYAGGVPAFREKCQDIARNNYAGFNLA